MVMEGGDTHPGLVEASVLAAHAEGLDGRRRLLSQQQRLLQLDLFLQFDQHGRLHAVPEEDMANQKGATRLVGRDAGSAARQGGRTWRRCGRSPAGRGRPAAAPCAALGQRGNDT